MFQGEENFFSCETEGIRWFRLQAFEIIALIKLGTGPGFNFIGLGIIATKELKYGWYSPNAISSFANHWNVDGNIFEVFKLLGIYHVHLLWSWNFTGSTMPFGE